MQTFPHNIPSLFNSFFLHLTQLPFHMNGSCMLPFPLELQVKRSGCSICLITPFVCPISPPITTGDNRKKQSNYKRFMFSQSSKWHSSSNSKQQVRFLPHLFYPQKGHYLRDYHKTRLVGILKPYFNQYL